MICFLDMDGVLVDLESKVDFSKHVSWDNYNSCFWATLPETKDCWSIIALASAYYSDVRLLTKYANAESAKGKIQWAERTGLPVVLTDNDKSFCAKGNVLIDDYDKNITAWRLMGGFGVLAAGFESIRQQLLHLEVYHG